MEVYFLSSPTSTHTTGSMFKPTSCRASMTVMLTCRQERGEMRRKARELGAGFAGVRAWLVPVWALLNLLVILGLSPPSLSALIYKEGSELDHLQVGVHQNYQAEGKREGERKEAGWWLKTLRPLHHTPDQPNPILGGDGEVLSSICIFKAPRWFQEFSLASMVLLHRGLQTHSHPLRFCALKN